MGCHQSPNAQHALMVAVGTRLPRGSGVFDAALRGSGGPSSTLPCLFPDALDESEEPMSIRPLLIGAAVSALAANALAQTPPPADVPPPPPPTSPTDAPPANPPPPPPAVEPPTLAPLPPPMPAPAEAPPPPKKLTVGKDGFFQPGLLLQGWFLFDRCPSCAGPTPSSVSTFRVRRAEIHMKGEIVPGVANYAVMIDPAKVLELQNVTVPVTNAPMPNTPPEQVTVRQPVSAISVLQDVFITFPTEYADVSLGQFKIPVSWEGYNSSSKLILPERSLVSRQFGDKRDLGLRIAKTFPYFGYSAGVFNGGGLNNLDTNNQKDFGLRLEAYPIPSITVAGVIYSSVGQRNRAGTKDRYEGDLRFDQYGVLVQAEYIYANDVATDYGPSFNSQGFYAALGYTFFDALQPIVRLGYIDPNTGRDSDQMWEYNVGLNYYIRKHESKLQLNYSRFPQARNEDELILAAQVAF